MDADMVTTLIPALKQPWHEQFSVFNVMHHGTHEKQLSNVFSWLMDDSGSHNLGDRFVGIFLDMVNRTNKCEPIPLQSFTVSQERNTAEPGEGKDVSDIVLEGGKTVVVIENYYRSDGHYHSHENYVNFAKRKCVDSMGSAVVLLCQYIDQGVLEQPRNEGWKATPIVTYSNLLAALAADLEHDDDYRVDNAQCYWFIEQLVSYFVKGTPVNEDLLTFVAGMCAVGEAERYRNGSVADADGFAEEFSKLARERYVDSRALLMKVKDALRKYSAGPLLGQLKSAQEAWPFGTVSANYRGIYQWTINLLPSATLLADTDLGDSGARQVQVKFGPSAWFANESEEGHRYFPHNVAPEGADYARLFLTWNGRIRQSTVSMQEVLEGLPEGDTRLRDEILELMESGT